MQSYKSYNLCIKGWPNLLRKLQGKQLELSVIQVPKSSSYHHIISLHHSQNILFLLFTKLFGPTQYPQTTIKFKAANVQGVWAGHFGRDHFQLHKEVEELFLYSNTDYYLPQKYLESEVLEKRRRQGAKFSATRL